MYIGDLDLSFSNFAQVFEDCDSEKEEYASWLSLFYGAGLSQSQFSKIMNYFKLKNGKSSSEMIPYSFDQVANKFLKETTNKLTFSKNYHCDNCKIVTDSITYSKQRHCLTCRERLTMNYYFDIENQIKKVIEKNIIDFKKPSCIDTQSVIYVI